MDADVNSYFLAQLEKLRLLRETKRGEVWLALLPPDRLVIWKRIRAIGLPYTLLANRPLHPLWPEILYCAEDETETVVVEDFVQGEPFSARLTENRFLSENEAENLLLQVVDGLSVLHGLGVVHRDIKPSNLILSESGIRLIDFDAARTMKEEKAEDTSLLGTKGYAPPEQFGYGQTDARSDIYALGVTFREMLGPDYQGCLSPVLRKCTELDPKRRYVSAEELKRAILMRRRWAKAKIACPVVLAALVGAALYLLPAPHRETPQESTAPTAPAEAVQPTTEEKPPIAVPTPETAKPAEPDEKTSDTPQETEEAAKEQTESPQPKEAPPPNLTAEEEAGAFLALFKDDPEKQREWENRKEGFFREIERQGLPPQEADDAKRDAIDNLRRMELGRRAEAFMKTLPKSMTADEKGRAYNEFVFEQMELLGITAL